MGQHMYHIGFGVFDCRSNIVSCIDFECSDQTTCPILISFAVVNSRIFAPSELISDTLFKFNLNHWRQLLGESSTMHQINLIFFVHLCSFFKPPYYNPADSLFAPSMRSLSGCFDYTPSDSLYDSVLPFEYS